MTVEPMSRPLRSGTANTLQWILIGLVLLATVVLPFVSDTKAVPVASLLLIPFMLLHGVRRYGRWLMLAFVVAAYVLSNFWENLSISSGFPFGHYHYTGHPQLIHVPLVIGPAYVALGYISWLTASVLLDRADEHLDWRTRAGRLNTFALPAIGAAVMTMFDVGSDSNVSTMNHVWIWDRGGGVFGVPFTNYLGWWFVVYTFLQVFALIAARVQTRAPQGVAVVAPGSLLQPVVAYLAVGLPSVIRFIAGSGMDTATDVRGTTWSVHDLNESMLTITVFGLITVAVLALAKIARGDTRHPPTPTT